MLYLRTLKIDKLIAEKVDRYVSIWEHNWKLMLQRDKQLKSRVEKMKSSIYPLPDHRACFYGGRTDLSEFVWHSEDHPDEYGIYRDIRY